MASIQEGTAEGPDNRLRTYEERLAELEAETTTVGTADKLADLAREILEDGRKLLAESRPTAASAKPIEASRPWIPYTDLVEVTELGDPFPHAIVAHVYEEQTGEGRHPDARAVRYVGTKTYVPIWEKEQERQARLDGLGNEARKIREELLLARIPSSSEFEQARELVRRLEEVAMRAIREARP